MKNLILCNIFAAFTVFGVTAMQDGASSTGEPAGSPLRRINSQTQLLLRAEGDEFKSSSAVGFDYKPYIAAHKPQLESICNGVRHCCSRLGVKKMTIYDKSGKKSTTVDALDISWGSIRSYAHKVLGEYEICPELKERLDDYLSILDNVTDRTRADIECNSTAFEGDELERLCAMCFEGEDSLFICGINSKIYDTNIFKEKFLVPTLCNFTGFQTIASLMVISILNQDSDVGFNRISRILVGDDNKYSLIPLSIGDEIKGVDPQPPLLLCVNPADISDPHIKFTHECLHAVGEMLGIFSISDWGVWNTIGDRSVFRTSQLDHVDLFAPIMKYKDLNNRIVSRLFDKITNGGKRCNQKVDQKKLEEWLNYLALRGVGSECYNFFNKSGHSNSATLKMITKVAYLYALLYATSCPATDKLVMYGILPLQYRRKPFVICSNQNEYIMTKREILAKDVDRIYDSEKDWGIYRYHHTSDRDGNELSMLEFVNIVIECIARRLSNIGLGEYEDLKEIVRDCFSKEDTSSLLASFYPSSLLHRMATEKGSVSISEEAETDIGDLFSDPTGLFAGLW